MRRNLAFIICLIISITASYGQDIVIKDIHLITMTSDTVINRQSVLLREGKIEQIDQFKNIPKNKKTVVINGLGKYLMPGLADMHVHLPETEKTDTMLMLNIAAGVTHIRVMNSKDPQSELKRKLADNPGLISPKVHYSHIIRRENSYTRPQADSLMAEIKKEELDFIKLFSLSDEATYDHITASAKANGITVCGHFPTYRDGEGNQMVAVEKVLAGNYKSIEHLAGYAWLPDESRLKEAIQLTKENGVYNCPTLDWDIMANDLQYPEEYKNRLTYAHISPGVAQKWEKNYALAIEEAGGKEKVIENRDKALPSFEKKKEILKMLSDQGCLLLIGGDAGNNFQADGFNVYEEMMNWHNAGIDNYTILKSATITPALFFNESHKWGTIEKGKDADLIILDKNPLEDIKNIATVETTIIQGKIYKKAELLKGL